MNGCYTFKNEIPLPNVTV